MVEAVAGELTPKREAFVLAYAETGNGAEAYRRAFNARRMSQHAIEVEASRLLTNPDVALRIKELSAVVVSSKIADIQERQEFLTSVIRGQHQASMSDRLRASELLGRAQGDFIERSVRINENVIFTMEIGENGPHKYQERLSNGVTLDLLPEDEEGLQDS